MKLMLPFSLSFMGLSLSAAHPSMESHVEILTTTHLKQSSIISTLSLLPTIQNIALLATLPALGIYTPALIGIGIISSSVQAISLGPGGGWNSAPQLPPSSFESVHKRRAHPRDISVAATSIEHKNSYHVAEVLIKKFGDLSRRIKGQHAEFESPRHLPKSVALGRNNADKGETTNIDLREPSTDSREQNHVIKSDFKIRRNGNTLRSRDVKSRSLVSRSRWQDFIHLCWGLGAHYNPNEHRCDSD
ncbi:hypothetical protein BOTCAL_0330g00060 [Botryotinia calthae]|uniref:Uncharacterized protein n=1 Tax=Botryotinia calthae TaxID=38488 RepID=A0A4Y8CU31_9HELO|nr:hypothetical protein BOTCAL_0330g00060 [Botryotinia calthae]